MKAEWNKYSEKFLQITPREQYLILATGLVFIIFVSYSLFIEGNLAELTKAEKSIAQLSQSNQSNKTMIATYKDALKHDPNIKVKKNIARYEKKLAAVDKKLLALTSELIDPIQMRHALLQLLDLQKGVSLVSFELVGVEEVTFVPKKKIERNSVSPKNSDKEEALENNEHLNLYRHGIKIKLKGSYFQLRDYLVQLESLSWKFFWQDFQYNLQTYPESELEIKMYSLSTKEEFLGV